MNPEEIRLRALEFATSYTASAGGYKTQKPLLELAAEIAAFIEAGKVPDAPKIEEPQPNTVYPVSVPTAPQKRDRSPIWGF